VSSSNAAERHALLGFLAEVVLPEAFDRRATIVVHLVGLHAYNAGTAVAVFDFATARDDELATPHRVIERAAGELVAAVQAAFVADAEPASDPLGFLRRVGDTRSQWPEADILGVYLGDGAQSTEGCDLALLPVSDQNSLEATAAACVGRHPLGLADIDFWLLGVGLTTESGDVSEAQALDTARFLTYAIETLGRGRVTCVSVAPLPGACG
jgi:hypothetical protein